jgi:hypothetical protein
MRLWDIAVLDPAPDKLRAIKETRRIHELAWR